MQFTTTRRVPFPADTVWAKVADVGNIADWLPGIGQSSATGFAVGERRTCTLDPPKQGIERIDETFTLVGDREFAYDIHGMPFAMNNHWRIEADDAGERSGDEAIVSVTSTIRPRGWTWLVAPLLGSMMRRQSASMLAALEAALSASE